MESFLAFKLWIICSLALKSTSGPQDIFWLILSLFWPDNRIEVSLVVQRLKASACNVGDLGSIPGSGRSPGEGSGNPLQYSCLENPMDGGAWWNIIHGSQRVGHDWATSLSLSIGMATHSSVLAWRIPGTVEPGGLPPMGSHRVGHDWSDLAAGAYLKEV